MKPDTRLCSAIPYLKRGGRVADVGTDHAYLPIYLVAEGISSAALACDINEGPIRSARANIAAVGLDDRISTLRTDGLVGVERFHPDDVMIFGMGGELIARILSDAPWVKSGEIGLILQPMTRIATLREWLLEIGFTIVGETITLEDKYYQTVAARYTGTVAHYTECELLIGRKNIEERPPHFEGLVRHEIGVLNAIIRGKSRSANADTEAEIRLVRALEELL
jgi:tRNA (adenine22-N1)-methyltransferase